MCVCVCVCVCVRVFCFCFNLFYSFSFRYIGFKNVIVSCFFVGLLVHVYFFPCFVPSFFSFFLLCVQERYVIIMFSPWGGVYLKLQLVSETVASAAAHRRFLSLPLTHRAVIMVHLALLVQ